MKTCFKKWIAVTIAVITAVSSGAFTAYAAEQDVCWKAAYYFRSSLSEFDRSADNEDAFVFCDGWFIGSSKTYNASLATASLSLAAASVSTTREPDTAEGYARKSRNAAAFLEDTGFADIDCNDDYRSKPTKDSCGVLCAHKRITDNGREYTLLAIVPRSAGYEAEWGGNFVIGASGDAKGFDDGAEKSLAYTKRYLKTYGIEGGLKVWTVGYSRGGAVVNLIGKKLIDDPVGYLGDTVTLDSGDLYAYTFGTPAAADAGNDPRAEKYACIFNTFSDNEVVSAMAPADMGFARYGADIVLTGSDNSDAMLYNLSVCDDSLYESCLAGSSPQDFSPKKLALDNDAIIIKDDPDSYIPSDEAVFLKEFCSYLTRAVGGREQYASVYEAPLSDFFAYYLSLSSEDSAAFLDALKNDEDTVFLISSLYAYFMSQKPQRDFTPTFSQLSTLVKELRAIGNMTDGGASPSVTRIAGELISYLRMDSDTLRKKAAEYLGKVLSDAMKAAGAGEKTIAALTSDASTQALAHFASHMLFGNCWQSEKAEPLNPDNEQIKNAATIIGNAMNLVFNHLNEVLISRMRTGDSAFDDYQPLTKAQAAGYRRVYLKTDSDTPIGGEILNGSGAVVGRIENGVLTRSADPWVGYTQADSGGFLRIPRGDSYLIRLTASDHTRLTAEVREYSVADAAAIPAFSDTVAVDAAHGAELFLPALADDSALPSGAAYCLTAAVEICGDADGDGEVTILDATAIQRVLADLPTVSFCETAADVDGDGLNITDATHIQRYLADLDDPYRIGEPVVADA